jgi:F-box-like
VIRCDIHKAHDWRGLACGTKVSSSHPLVVAVTLLSCVFTFLRPQAYVLKAGRMSLCAQCRSLRDSAFHFTPLSQRVDDPRRQLEDLEAEITHVEKLLAQLVRQRVPLKRKINARFSPVLQLPVEITSEIFMTCFPPNAWELWGSKTPLDLGKVCSTWRDIAWSMPWLWNTVSLSVPHLSPTHTEMLDEWLFRSGQLPLSIRLKVKFGFDSKACSAGVYPSPMLCAMDAIARFSTRLRNVDLCIPDLLCDRLSSIFHAAPLLHDIKLKGFYPKTVALPVSQLTRLRLNPTTFEECLEVLASSPQLIYCTFEEILCSDVRNPSPILAPSLESLEVISSTHIALSELLDNLLIPAARELAFHVTGNIFPDWSFISLIARSSCTLHRLSLSGIRTSERVLWGCLEVIPSLVHLNISNVECVTNNTIAVLDPTENIRCRGCVPVLPNLKSLKYSGDLSQLDLGDIADMLEARWRRGVPATGLVEDQRPPAKVARLLSVQFDTKTFDGRNLDARRRLRELFEEGMKIVISCDDVLST